MPIKRQRVVYQGGHMQLYHHHRHRRPLALLDHLQVVSHLILSCNPTQSIQPLNPTYQSTL